MHEARFDKGVRDDINTVLDNGNICTRKESHDGCLCVMDIKTDKGFTLGVKIDPCLIAAHLKRIARFRSVLKNEWCHKMTPNANPFKSFYL